MSLFRRLALNTAAQLVGKVASTAIGVIIVGLLTRYLGQDGFGAYSTANAFLQIFTLFLDLGINVTFVALLGEHADDPAYERRCVSALFTFRLVCAGFLTILAPLLGWLSPYPLEIKLAIVALTGSLLFPGLTQLITGVQQRHLQTQVGALGEVLGRVVLLIGIFIARASGWGLVPIMWFVSLGSAANFFLNIWLTRPRGLFRWNWDLPFWKTTLMRSWPIGVSIFFNLLYYKGDTLVLSFTRSQAEVGIYSAAYRVLEILITIPFMLAGLMLPLFSEAWGKGDKARLTFLTKESASALMFLIAPMVMGTVVLADRIILLVAGPDFAASADILRVLIVATGIIFMNVIYAHVVVAIQAQRKMLPIYIATALGIGAGYIFLIPRYGMWAAAWLTVASEIFVTAGSYVVARRSVPMGLHLRSVVVAWASAAVMAAVLMALPNLPLLALISLGAVVYGALLIALKAVPKELILQLMKKTPTV
ncbi:flippase [Patescibacteria group bacterium]|nr:flippase [Patescibacteria group bacterium]MBP9710397.1 flippase [Patescibacteria group bacterium]